MPPDLNSRYTPLKLTDDSGTVLTEDTQMPGMYNITSAGALTKYFYLPVNTISAIEIIDMLFTVDSAVTLSVELQCLQLGAANWQPVPAYTTGAYAADGTSQEMNSSFPLRHVIPANNEYRVMATVGAACDIGVQTMARAL